MAIHPTAIVSPDAEIGKNVEIGPYSVIEDNVKIGDGCFIDAHVKIARYTTVGPRCHFYYGALIGEEPQDHRFYKGLVSYTEIGSDNVFREYVTVHRPPFEGFKTIIGNHCLFMAFVHVAHDCVIADRVTVANHTAISGHVEIESGVVVSGYVKIHQFCRIGSLAMISSGVLLGQDVPPFCTMMGNGYIVGPNTIGLRRAGMNTGQRTAIRKAIKNYFFQGLNSKNACDEIAKSDMTPEVEHFVNFIRASKRGISSGNPNQVKSSE